VRVIVQKVDLFTWATVYVAIIDFMLRCAKAHCDWLVMSALYKSTTPLTCRHYFMMDTPQTVRDIIVKRHLIGQQSWRQIATTMGLPKSTVSNILRQYQQHGIIGTKRAGKCGRKRSLTKRDERALARASQVNPRGTARQLRASVGGSVTSVSVSTIKRSLQRLGRLAFRPSKSPSFTCAQRQKRLQWCRAHAHWNSDMWKKVSFGVCLNLT
jgi:transposase